MPESNGLPESKRKVAFVRSLQHALRGVFFVLRTERNAQIEAVIALFAILLGIVLRISAVEWAVIFTLIGLVLGLEFANTALEAVVDLATSEYHPLAKIAKDSAAGAVLWVAGCSVVVGLFVFGPRLWRLLVVLVQR
ncbi:MAG: diacylglycerol kinase family protein [Caldilineaceae bacterium]|nr:diacylglycerol kinase family protein [Caldilineaceae bacterium]